MSKSGVTVTQLADELGVSVSYVTQMVRGTRRLKRNPVLRRRIADALDVPQHWIEHREDEAA